MQSAKIYDLREWGLIHSKADFQTNYGNIRAAIEEGGKIKYTPLPKLWLESENRRTASRVGFCIGEGETVALPDGGTVLNLWRGLELEPNPNFNVKQVEEFYVSVVREMLEINTLTTPSGYADAAEYFLDILACIVQHPEKRLGLYINLFGANGTGKNYSIVPLGSALGSRHAPTLRLEQYLNKFNSRKWAARVIVLNEVGKYLDHKDASALEAELKLDADVNELTRELELKGKDIITVERNCTPIIIGNYPPAFPVPWTERRGVFLQASPTLAVMGRGVAQATKKDAWWADRWEWMNGPGAADVLGWLMQRKLKLIPGEQALSTNYKESVQRGQGERGVDGWTSTLRNKPEEVLHYNGHDLSEYRYFTTAQLKMMYQQHSGGDDVRDTTLGLSLDKEQVPGRKMRVPGLANPVKVWDLRGAAGGSIDTGAVDTMKDEQAAIQKAFMSRLAGG